MNSPRQANRHFLPINYPLIDMRTSTYIVLTPPNPSHRDATTFLARQHIH